MKLLIDQRTGEPTFTLEGDLRECNYEREFNQIVDCLLRTPLQSEAFLPTWGLPIRDIIRASSHPFWESIIKYIIVTALSERSEPIISSIESVELTRNAGDDANLAISIHVKSVFGTESKNLVKVNE